MELPDLTNHIERVGSSSQQGSRTYAGGIAATRHGGLSFQLTVSQIVSLAINVVQNGWIVHALGLEPAAPQIPERRATESDGLSLGGDLAADARWLTTLEEIYQELLRANREQVERKLARSTGRAPRNERPSRSHQVLSRGNKTGG